MLVGLLFHGRLQLVHHVSRVVKLFALVSLRSAHGNQLDFIIAILLQLPLPITRLCLSRFKTGPLTIYYHLVILIDVTKLFLRGSHSGQMIDKQHNGVCM